MLIWLDFCFDVISQRNEIEKEINYQSSLASNTSEKNKNVSIKYYIIEILGDCFKTYLFFRK